MSIPIRLVAFAGSNRKDSLNRRLLDAAVELAADRGAEVDVIDLRRYPLPLYDADLQARDGIPLAAEQLVERIAAAEGVLIANPEYNGGYPALFKNTIDWMSRVDMFLFQPRLVGLLSTTPGGRGGRRGIDATASLFEGMGVTVHGDGFALPRGHEAVTAEGWADEDEHVRLASWIDGFVGAVEARRAGEDAEDAA